MVSLIMRLIMYGYTSSIKLKMLENETNVNDFPQFSRLFAAVFRVDQVGEQYHRVVYAYSVERSCCPPRNNISYEYRSHYEWGN